MAEQNISKREELAQIILEGMRRIDVATSDDEANKVLDTFCEIQLPEIEGLKLDTNLYHTRFDKNEWKGGAVNIKPGNIKLNMRKLLTVVASGVLTVGGAVSAPWTIPFAALILWNTIYSGIQCNISERDAVVLWVMWHLRNDMNHVLHCDVLPEVNRELQKAGRLKIPQQQFDEAIENLTSLRCIEKSKNSSEQWWMREWVSINYN